MLGNDQDYQDGYLEVGGTYKFIVQTLCREYGLFVLRGTEDRAYGGGYRSELANFLLRERDPERLLDVIELSFKVIDKMTPRWDYLHRMNAAKLADDAIEELNVRFREHGIGYEFNDDIIRVDSQLLHAEAVRPALALLMGPEYKGAQAEFLTAHEHYRHGRKKEALTESLKAFESVMKSICAKRKWTHDPNAPANAVR